MSFQWLQMRITEEKDRRERENNIHQRLPPAFEELRAQLAKCIETYNDAFGAGTASMEGSNGAVRVTSGESSVQVHLDLAYPGYQVDQPSGHLSIEVGILPGGNLYYRDAEKYLTLEEVTRRILDRTLFPKLKD